MIDDILLVVKLVNYGSFANLAKKLNIAQSTVSRRVQLLEERLGVKLIKRDSRNLALTEKGKILYENFKEREQELMELINPLFESNKEVTGKLNILLPISLSQHLFTPYFYELITQHPKLELNLYYSFEPVNMNRDDYDIAIIGYLPQQATQKIRQIHTLKIVPVCSKIFVEKYGEITDFSQVGPYMAIGKLGRPPQMDSTVKIFSETSDEYIEIAHRFNINMNSFLEVNKIIRTSPLIGGLPEESIREELESGELIRLFPGYHLGYLPLYMLRNISADDLRYKVFNDFVTTCIRRQKVENLVNSKQIFYPLI